MKQGKPLLVTAVLTAVAGGLVLTSTAASAESDNTSLISRLASAFNVSEQEVQDVFDEHRETEMAEREVEHEEHLQSLVDDGVITDEQKTTLEEFHTKIREQRQSFKDRDLSREEVHQAMQELRTEFEEWLASEDLSIEDIRPEHEEGEGRHGHRIGHRFHHGGDLDDNGSVED